MKPGGADFQSYRIEVERDMSADAEEAVAQAVTYLQQVGRRMLTGPRTGRFYKIPGTNRYYQASAPGEPPAERLGDLRDSLDTAMTRDAEWVAGYMGTPLFYGRDLEVGTMNVLPRPWMSRLFAENRREVRAILEGAFL